MPAPTYRPIQGLAKGFLQLLGIQNLGKMPEELIGSVQPVMEMRDWYLRALAENSYVNGGVALAASSFVYSGIAVPENQVWYVHSHTVGFRITGAVTTVTALAFSAARTDANARSVVIGEALQPPSLTLATIGTATVFRAPSLGGFYAPPGTRFGYNCSLLNIENAGVTAGEFDQWINYSPIQL